MDKLRKTTVSVNMTSHGAKMFASRGDKIMALIHPARTTCENHQEPLRDVSNFIEESLTAHETENRISVARKRLFSDAFDDNISNEHGFDSIAGSHKIPCMENTVKTVNTEQNIDGNKVTEHDNCNPVNVEDLEQCRQAARNALDINHYEYMSTTAVLESDEIPPDAEILNKLLSTVNIMKQQRKDDQKAGRISSARRKCKVINTYNEAIQTLQKGGKINLSDLPKPSPVKQNSSNLSLNENDQPSLEDIGNEGDESPPRHVVKKRIGKKENYCLYCKKLVKEYCVHLEKHHPDTPEGKELFNITSIEKDPRRKGKLKREVTDKLRKRANAIYNEMVINDFKKGNYEKKVILVKERHNRKETAENTVVCSYCKGYYKKDRISVHLKLCREYTCSLTEKVSLGLKNHSTPLSVIGDIKGASEELKSEVLKNMHEDDVKKFAINDPLIMRFGSEFHRSRRDPIHHNYTASKIRDLTNLVMKMKEVQPILNESRNDPLPDIQTLEDCCNPANFETLVESSLKLSGYDPNSGKLEIPSMAYRLSQPLKIAANIAQSDYLCKNYSTNMNDLSKYKMFKHFITLVDKHWADKIGRIATKMRKAAQAGLQKKFAHEEDIVRICSYIVSEYRKLMSELKNSDVKKGTYNRLMDLLVTHIMCLMRRRPVDFKRATCLHFTLLDKQDELINMVQASNASGSDQAKFETADLEKCKNFHIFYVPGKNLEVVPIVLTPLMKNVLDTLINHRKEVGIVDDKPERDLLFLMSQGKSVNPILCMRNVKSKVCLKSPNTLTNNGLRHHAATFSRLHSKHPQYQDYLASALGHSLTTHKKHYELPTSILQKLYICPILHNMTLGKPSLSKEGNVAEDRVEGKTNEEQSIQTRLEDDEGRVEGNTNEEQTPRLEEAGSEIDDPSFAVPSDCESNEEESVIKKQTKFILRTRWDSSEKELIYSYFGKHILNKEMPSWNEVKQFYNKNKSKFNTRSVSSVYTFINNNVKRKQKNVSPSVKKCLPAIQGEF